jgi:hypothetical protein
MEDAPQLVVQDDSALNSLCIDPALLAEDASRNEGRLASALSGRSILYTPPNTLDISAKLDSDVFTSKLFAIKANDSGGYWVTMDREMYEASELEDLVDLFTTRTRNKSKSYDVKMDQQVRVSNTRRVLSDRIRAL